MTAGRRPGLQAKGYVKRERAAHSNQDPEADERERGVLRGSLDQLKDQEERLRELVGLVPRTAVSAIYSAQRSLLSAQHAVKERLHELGDWDCS